MSEAVVMVLDCGSTNVRAIAVSESGKVIARASEKNETIPDENHEDWHYWPFEELYKKICTCARKVAAEVGKERFKAVTVTTFGADGTFLDASGKLLFPVISWKCTRTIEAQEHVKHYLDPDKVVATSGVGFFSFNTLNKFVWYRENRPDLLENSEHFVFISSLFNYRLTGRLTNDATMVGTSQMTEIQTQDFSPEILGALGVRRELFPEMIFPGEVVGALLPEGADAIGLDAGTPVVSAGHDTQFAVFGAGAQATRPVLSSGTWEILMARCPSISVPGKEVFADAFTCEWDVLKGHYTPGYQYVASAVVEWIGNTMFSELSGSQRYIRMIEEARKAPEDCRGLTITPDFLVGKGAMGGLSLDVDRGTLYRATLNSLVQRLKSGLDLLEQVGNFKSTELTLVGGGSRNKFWTQLKANAIGLPIKTIEEPETTVLGAAMFAMQGAGIYASAEEAREAFNLSFTTTLPE